MKPRSWRRWWPVALFVGGALAFMLFAFVPFHRRAREQSEETRRLSGELEAKVALIESLPKQKADLDVLVAKLSRFRGALSGTHEVDRGMDRFRSRAEAVALDMWTLNPSVPVLIKLDSGVDSLARLDLAILPVAFECHGAFEDVARFLESEETRPDFHRWNRLTLSADPLAWGVQARAEVQLFLLPASPEEYPL